MAAADGKVALSLSEMLGSDKSRSEEESSAAPKKNFQPYHAQSVPKSEDLEGAAFVRQSSGESQEVTTMMLRNIPNKYTQNSLLQEINDLGFAGTFDFFYLPMDVHNRSNVGYAFINFLRPNDAEYFRTKFSDHRFQRFQSRKISSVCTAHVQGLHENLRHFENRAVTHARNDQYRPVVLRNGARVDLEEVLGECKTRAPSSSFDSLPGEKRGDSPKTSTKAPTAGRSRLGSKDSDAAGGKGHAGASKGQPSIATGGAVQPKQSKKQQVQQAAPAAPSMASGRRGLEDAIRGAMMHQQGSQQCPAPSMTSLAPPPGLGASEPAHSDAAVAAALMAHQAEAEAVPGSDVMQLLGLRSRLFDRLVQKDADCALQIQAYQQALALLNMQQQVQQVQQGMGMQATPTLNPMSPPFSPGVMATSHDPAYIELPSSLYSTKSAFDMTDSGFDNSDMLTPRTNRLMLQSSLRANNAWL